MMKKKQITEMAPQIPPNSGRIKACRQAGVSLMRSSPPAFSVCPVYAGGDGSISSVFSSPATWDILSSSNHGPVVIILVEAVVSAT
jgi:hypothetical protein